jgi:hypothetical protein
MLNQNEIKDKFRDMKKGFKNFVDKVGHKDEEETTQADRQVNKDADVVGASSRGENYDFEPDKERSSTAPEADEAMLSDTGTSDAQKLVWENENASMQDKTYSFDEDNTDADYDNEDSLNFEDESGSGQQSRYS